MGPELMNKFKKQAEKFGTEIKNKKIDKVDFSGDVLKLWSGDEEFLSDSVIISTGASARLLGLESEKKLMGYGVSACATCDAFFFKDKKVFVVGGGDSAMEEALFLTKFASSVTLIHRRDVFRASKIMQEKAFNNKKIDVMWNSSIIDMIGEPDQGGLKSIMVKNLLDGSINEIDSDGVFLGIGHTPNSEIFKDYINLNDKGYILTYNNSTETSKKGVFAAGDIMDPIYRQAITAAGSGCMSALDAEKYLENL
jgi:thioredoxin reductase (NADPH)